MQVGEQVLSRDPDTGQDGVKTVTGTISRPADTLVTLALVDPSTHKTSTMTCTPGHPVYVEGKGWIEAGDLVAGNAIVTRTGSELTVASLQWQRDETGKHPFTVYNLEVANDHTYFAGDFDGGLWVHNAFICGKGGTVDKDLADKWNPGSFSDQTENLSYHLAKHGDGRTLEQYTQDAEDFFNNNRSSAQWGQWNPNWQPLFRLKLPGIGGGYFDGQGRILTYWD